MKLILVRRPAAMWTYCVDLVRETYARSFGAAVDPNPDAFVAGYSGPAAADAISACAGLSFGSDRPFFSERYLDDEIAAEIERVFGARPDRQRVVEVGPLASRRGGAGKEIIRLTPVITWCLGMRYLVCTATAPLIGVFRHLRIPFSALRPASRDRLAPAERDRWGSYYDTDPVVGVIPLDGIAALFSDTTGRYAFTDPEITLLDDRAARAAGVATGG